MLDKSDLRNRRILVIDDNRRIHEDFRKIFHSTQPTDSVMAETELVLFSKAPVTENGPMFEVDSAYQGQEGLALVQQALREQRPYAMAFVDVRMPPGWDGIVTIARIWQEYPDLQVVICTAYSDYSLNDILLELGQSDRLVILKKPFDNIEVLQLSHTLTEKWRLLQQAKAKAGELQQRVEERTQELQAAIHSGVKSGQFKRIFNPQFGECRIVAQIGERLDNAFFFLQFRNFFGGQQAAQFGRLNERDAGNR